MASILDSLKRFFGGSSEDEHGHEHGHPHDHAHEHSHGDMTHAHPHAHGDGPEEDDTHPH